MDITESLITETSFRYDVGLINNQRKIEKSLECEMGFAPSD
jgi:hypothetical protein